MSRYGIKLIKTIIPFYLGEGFQQEIFMNFLKLLLMESLQNKNPLLDLKGADRKVLQVAYEDLLNYLKVHWNLIAVENSDLELADKAYNFFKENPKEFEEFLNVWAGLWMKKWIERVKLLIGKEHSRSWKKTNRLLSIAEPYWNQLRKKKEMKEIVVKTLIKNGEICGTSILAENIIKTELGSTAEKAKLRLNDKETILNVLTNTLRKAREISRSKGPLIFVRIDKSFFNLAT